MSDNNEIDNIRSKIKQEQKTYDENLQKEFSEVVSWSKVYQPVSLRPNNCLFKKLFRHWTVMRCILNRPM